MLTELNMNRKNPNPLNTMGDKTLKRGENAPWDVQKMNATTNNGTTTTRTIPNEVANLADAMDGMKCVWDLAIDGGF